MGGWVGGWAGAWVGCAAGAVAALTCLEGSLYPRAHGDQADQPVLAEQAARVPDAKRRLQALVLEMHRLWVAVSPLPPPPPARRAAPAPLSARVSTRRKLSQAGAGVRKRCRRGMRRDRPMVMRTRRPCPAPPQAGPARHVTAGCASPRCTTTQPGYRCRWPRVKHIVRPSCRERGACGRRRHWQQRLAPLAAGPPRHPLTPLDIYNTDTRCAPGRCKRTRPHVVPPLATRRPAPRAPAPPAAPAAAPATAPAPPAQT